MKKILATCLGMFSLLANAEGVQIGEKTLIREVVASNPGQEVIVPYASLNTAKTKVTLRFDVYPLASTTKLFSTGAYIFTLPTVTCATNSPLYLNGWDNGLVAPSTGGLNQAYAFQVTRSCSAPVGSVPQWIQRTDTLIYGANVSSSAGAKWGVTISDTYLQAMQVVNADADAAYELLLVMDSPKSVPAAGTKKRVQILNLVTGATEVPAKDRVVKSTNLAPEQMM